MNSTQIKKPHHYILGGLGGVLLGILLLFLLEYFLQAPNKSTLTYWQMMLAVPVYLLLFAAIFFIFRGLSLAYRCYRYPNERP